jgi:hypothetical protein
VWPTFNDLAKTILPSGTVPSEALRMGNTAFRIDTSYGFEALGISSREKHCEIFICKAKIINIQHE